MVLEDINSDPLLSLCTEYQLVITNTCFWHKPAHKMSWMHPRSRCWHLIEYVITRQRDLVNICDTGVLGTSCSTDHIMIRLKTRLKLKRVN